jgi:phytoene dehydrogenase-like protein
VLYAFLIWTACGLIVALGRKVFLEMALGARAFATPAMEPRAQKNAQAVIAILEKSVADVRPAIEEIDVSTPATVIRYTGNWKGSMEGWLLTPGIGFKPLRQTLPGLRQFLMVGQWVMPGGGLPSGLMTARSAIQAVCKQDRIPFAPRKG